jgi:hypothetical protein
VLFALALSFFAGGGVWAEATRVTNPSALYVEMGGRTLGYGVGFDRVISDDLAVGFGVGGSPLIYTDVEGTSAGVNATLIPAYINYYLNEDAGSLFLTVGATFVSGSVTDLKARFSGTEFPSTPVLPTFGWCYENRGDQGFLFRVSGYGIYGKKLLPWVGFSFGYAF